jgi:hypothetical protein
MRPEVMAVAKRLVVEATEEKKLVVVAKEVVELTAVKLWRVVEPVRAKVESEERPVTERAPPTERAPVVVALLEVELTAVKFWRVVEPLS